MHHVKVYWFLETSTEFLVKPRNRRMSQHLLQGQVQSTKQTRVATWTIQRSAEKIARSKSKHFEGLCKKSDSDSWDGAHKTVMCKIKDKRSQSITRPNLLDESVMKLFPQNVNTGILPIVQVDIVDIRIVS